VSGAERVVIVGASLAGLHAAEALRNGGFTGNLTLVGEEPHLPYDRPPLSKQVALGMVGHESTTLPQQRSVNARWRLSTRAIGLDLAMHTVALANGEREPFDRLLIATGTRARPWGHPREAELHGVLTLRTREDAALLRSALQAHPKRVVVIGGGFNGSEIASACCSLGIPVTLIESNATPLAGALGCVVGRAAAALQSANGVDLRCGTRVERLEGDADGNVRRVHLTGDDTPIEASLVIVALGAIPNIEWLAESGLAASPHGVFCDAYCRAFDRFGIATDDVYVAGDVARFPHPLFDFEFVTLEHWGNAVAMAGVAVHNMLHPQGMRCPHIVVPAFWSSQFDVSIKSVGLPAIADQVMIVQGSLRRGEFVALYGKRGRVVGAAAFDQGKWLPHYEKMIEARAAFPGPTGMDVPPDARPQPAEFPTRSARSVQTLTALRAHMRTDQTNHACGCGK
jgi:NADPH-dependent 2,4-dienoyl-CoA reductase/sulfur reductase-like enzyme